MRAQRTAQKKMERYPPSYRVRRALSRLSRDRWVPGEEVEALCTRLSRCCSPGAWAHVSEAAMCLEGSVVGIIRGKPVAYKFDPEYMSFVGALKHRKINRGAAGEMKILDLLIRRGK